ncbi:MAG: patatin family protein [Eubacteriaceae bacterium]|jgi:predicted patatin/cPLA2 family phospholipase|nr:patatin family protein [Eubacteriaceae bacterium]
MLGILDAGGGMRAVYAAGVYDYLLDKGIEIPYCIGVSAGSANQVSYLAHQRGRNYPFYEEYAFRSDYMGPKNYVTKGSFIDLDYIYSVLTNEDGENPLDYDEYCRNPAQHVIVTTVAETAQPHYFHKEDLKRNAYEPIKASSCMPMVCRPWPIDGVMYYDGGVSDPIPYAKAFGDGCDKLICIVTRPRSFRKGTMKGKPLAKYLLRRYPAVYRTLEQRYVKWNHDFKAVQELEREGKCLLICPDDSCGVSSLTRDAGAFAKLYTKGYTDAAAIGKFI